MKRLVYLLLSLVVVASCGKTRLPRDHWEKNTYKALNGLLRAEGKSARGYDAQKRPYAVFDFDNTSIINDVEISMMVYQLENLRLKIAPERMYSLLLEGVPDTGVAIAGSEGHPVTATMLAKDIESDYKYLYDNYISLRGNQSEAADAALLKKIRKTREFKDFRAKVYALSKGIDDSFDYATGCLWLLKLLVGMTPDEITALVRESTVWWMTGKDKQSFAEGTDWVSRQKNRVRRVRWESPQMGQAGKVAVDTEQGIAVTKEMRHLYRALLENGFDVYICSASMERVVEAMACDPAFGFGLDPAHVFGIRLVGEEEGPLKNAVYARDYEQPYQEGKVQCILRYIAPAHGGRGPALVAGDSTGDLNMLTEFPDLKVGLVVNCLRPGTISELAAYAQYGAGVLGEDPISIAGKDTRYVLQGRNYPKGRFIRKPTSKALK